MADAGVMLILRSPVTRAHCRGIALILSGWKEIAKYLGCGVRTAQRWEANGVPVRRPFPGRRSHVIATSEDLDSWVRDSAFWRAQDMGLLAKIQRCRELRQEVQRARENLHLKMNALRNELAALRAKRRQREMG